MTQVNKHRFLVYFATLKHLTVSNLSIYRSNRDERNRRVICFGFALRSPVLESFRYFVTLFGLPTFLCYECQVNLYNYEQLLTITIQDFLRIHIVLKIKFI